MKLGSSSSDPPPCPLCLARRAHVIHVCWMSSWIHDEWKNERSSEVVNEWIFEWVKEWKKAEWPCERDTQMSEQVDNESSNYISESKATLWVIEWMSLCINKNVKTWMHEWWMNEPLSEWATAEQTRESVGESWEHTRKRQHIHESLHELMH